ncbi:acetyl-CoA acetyltransferase [Nocardioides sp. LHG3406-4]|uniref:acetyl-CoA acetyltransferase n=1 Tax=Nocardioides sp. LHG3406-4 TaxID=2804575 RepID=UPI003CF0B8DB
MSLRSRAAIVGAAEADVTPGHGRSPLGLAGESAVQALAEAGLTMADVDGVFTTSSYHGFPGLNACEYLGLDPRHVDTTAMGGCSFVSHLGHAAAAIETGQCDVALVTYGSTQRSDGGRLVSLAEKLVFEEPYGLIHPIGAFGMIAHRHMSEYGTTSEDLARVAVSAREWARLNPAAPSHEPLTVEDVLASKMIATPLHKLDCCLVTDGGASVVLTSAERARDLPQRPVYVRGAGEAVNHRNILAMPDLTTTRAADSAARALRMADLRVEDMDSAHVYDAFTISLLILLEDLGFCPKGEGGGFVSDGHIAPGGSLPLNTTGGGLSYTHPGMLGMFLILDAVEQLRGAAGGRQVDGATHALVHGMGLTLAAHATAVLSTEA